MTVVGAPTAGIVKYDWVTTDWDAGKLYGGTFAPSTQFYIDHKMEYEVVTASTRTTFPNNNYDILRISADLGNS